MRILIANDTYPPDVNGSAYFTKRLAEGFAQRGHEAHVMAASRARRTEVATRDGGWSSTGCARCQCPPTPASASPRRRCSTAASWRK